MVEVLLLLLLEEDNSAVASRVAPLADCSRFAPPPDVLGVDEDMAVLLVQHQLFRQHVNSMCLPTVGDQPDSVRATLC